MRRAAELDRTARARQRIEEVHELHERGRRRRRVGEAAAWVLTAVLATLIGASLWGPRGAGWALVSVLVLLGGTLLSRRLAARRGAEAWDWQAGRHRLVGRPARRVQLLDEPREDRPGQ